MEPKPKLTDEEWAALVVERWRMRQRGYPRTRLLLTLIMKALGGYVYEQRTGRLIPTEDTDGRSARDYAVDLVAEHDGVWVSAHRRKSGRWGRNDRAAHPSAHKGSRALAGVQ